MVWFAVQTAQGRTASFGCNILHVEHMLLCPPCCTLPLPSFTGWKLLGEVAEQWGGPPSPTTLLCVLRGLEQQLEQGELPHDVLRAAARAAADLGQQAPQAQQAQQADAAPARWPPLDSDLAAAVLRLLRRSAAAADADPQPGADSGADVLLEGGRSLLLGLAAAGQPVEAGLCEELFESFSQQAALEQWAVEAFGSAVVARVNRQVVEGIGAPLVLRPLSSLAGQRAQKAEQQQPAQPEAVDGSDSSSGSPRKRAKRASADEVRRLLEFAVTGPDQPAALDLVELWRKADWHWQPAF